MSNVIDLGKFRTEKQYKVTTGESYGDRIARIRASLEKINKQMEDSKKGDNT